MNQGQEKSPNIPLQQTKTWYKLQQELDEKTIFLAEDNYQILIIEKSTPYGPYFYLPYGPYIANKNAAKKAYEAVLDLAKQKNVIFIRIEPQNAKIASYWLEQPNCKKSKDLSPKETWILDLTQDLDEIYKNMKQNTRNLAKNYQNKGILVKKFVYSEKDAEKLKILTDFQKQVAKKDHFTPATENYLKTQFKQPFASLFVAYKEKTPISASLFFDDEKTRYYMQSASDQNFRNMPGTHAILIEAIKEAKNNGLKSFDFWGIAPENADKNHPWYGFTKFKKSFGGTEKIYAGTHDIILKPAKYRLYNLSRKINLFIRKLKK